MTGVIYARYSSDNQREESIEGQIRENTAFAEKNGIKIIEHYIDRAYSAKTDNRPEFQRMIKDSANGTYLVFDRDTSTLIGSAITNGTAAIIGVGGLAVGAVLGAIIAKLAGKKKNKETAAEA